MIYDAFNGDADGLCALHQLRLAEPVKSTLITGVKRDTQLLKKIDAQPGDEIVAVDIAVARNATQLEAALAKGVRVRWFDHHASGTLPVHPNFHATIDTSADICTSLLMDRHLNGAYRAWAVAAAFGDNLHDAARRAAEPLGLGRSRLDDLRELGECLNYNGYGDSLEDLHFHPADLYRAMQPYADPFDFLHEAAEFHTLRTGYLLDMVQARSIRAAEVRPSGAVYVLPDEPWARRVSGVYANDLASTQPQRAHAVLTRSSQGYYTVSVRAPMVDRRGADQLCKQFETGGGRAAAAGINILPEARIPDFIHAFFLAYPISRRG